MPTPQPRGRAPRAPVPAPRALRHSAPLLACSLILALVACGGTSSDESASVVDMAEPAPTAPPPPPAPVAPPAPEARQARRFSVGGQAADAVASKIAATAGPASADAGMRAIDADVASAAQAATTMIIRTGTASVEVGDVDSASAQVRALVARLGGYVANSALQAGHDQIRTAVLEVKVPAERFEQALVGLRPLGTVEVVNVDAQDVGEEYTDLTARAANSHRLEERLVELLATRTGKLDDVLAVERELARVREEIERMEGRMRYLRARAAMSTLTVTLHEPLPLAGTGPGDNAVLRALQQAWENFVGVIAWLIAAAGALLPLALLGALLWVLLRRAGVSLRPPRTSRPGAPPAPPPADA